MNSIKNTAQAKKHITEYYDDISIIYNDLYNDRLSLAENEKVKRMIKDLMPDTSAKILDLGCGDGLATDMIPWENYVGIDISPEMIYLAKKNKPSVRYQIADMEEMPFKDCSFSYVISLFGSFSHSLDPSRTIKEIQRVLKPGGKFFIMTYSQYSLINLRKVVQKGLCIGSVGPIQEYKIRNLDMKGVFAIFYTKSKLLRLFRDFENLSIYGLNSFCELYPIKKRLQKSNRASKVLEVDTRLTKIFPNLGHSLIISGQKQ